MKLQLNNKFRYSLYAVLACVFLSSCSGYGDKDGKIVKDADGKYYRLDHRAGVVYALEEINKAEIDSLNVR